MKVYPNSFTAKYNCNKLVYYETFGRIEDAIAREKQLKKWNRSWKNKLISDMNPEWKYLFIGLKIAHSRCPVGAGHDGDVVAICSGSKLTQKRFPQIDFNSTTR